MRGRNSDNRLIAEKLSWKPSASLYEGLQKTYRWIDSQVRSAKLQADGIALQSLDVPALPAIANLAGAHSIAGQVLAQRG